MALLPDGFELGNMKIFIDPFCEDDEDVNVAEFNHIVEVARKNPDDEIALTCETRGFGNNKYLVNLLSLKDVNNIVAPKQALSEMNVDNLNKINKKYIVKNFGDFTQSMFISKRVADLLGVIKDDLDIDDVYLNPNKKLMVEMNGKRIVAKVAFGKDSDLGIRINDEVVVKSDGYDDIDSLDPADKITTKRDWVLVKDISNKDNLYYIPTTPSDNEMFPSLSSLNNRSNKNKTEFYDCTVAHVGRLDKDIIQAVDGLVDEGNLAYEDIVNGETIVLVTGDPADPVWDIPVVIIQGDHDTLAKFTEWCMGEQFE